LYATVHFVVSIAAYLLFHKLRKVLSPYVDFPCIFSHHTKITYIGMQSPDNPLESEDMSIVGTEVTVKAADKNSLWILPLSVLPPKTPGLRKVRLIKNNHIKGVVEMFASDGTGSGHIRPFDLRETFADIDTGDTAMIEKLAALHSYDVYSLRISLREMGVDVADSKHLTLSKGKQEELAVYMKPFTDRLIMQIYGDDEDHGEDIDIQALFRDADPEVARQKLKTISESLIRALNMAIALRRQPRGCIHHSDRGSQYCSHDYQKLLRLHGFKVSMSGKGNCYPASAMRDCFCSAVSFCAFGTCKSMRDFESSLRLRENAIAESPSNDGNAAY
jgi:hypothetical protein